MKQQHEHVLVSSAWINDSQTCLHFFQPNLMFEIKYSTLIVPNEGSDYTLWKLMAKEQEKTSVTKSNQNTANFTHP